MFVSRHEEMISQTFEEIYLEIVRDLLKKKGLKLQRKEVNKKDKGPRSLEDEWDIPANVKS